jgi:tetratricopeptide (TPR) repeat protein
MGLEHSEATNRICELRRGFLSLLFALVFAKTGMISAQQIESGAGQTQGRSAIRADNLARGRYAERQRATLEMWRMRQSSRQAVQDAARHADPEVAQRAAWILKQWRSGALPGVSKTRPSSLLDRGTPSALATVLEQGAFDAVLVAVEESAGTIEFDQIKRSVARSLKERYPIYTDMAFADGTESDLLMLLDAVSVDRSLATARRDLMRYLEIKIDDSNRLPSAASLWSQTEKEICLSQFAMLRGDQQESIEHARNSGDAVLLRIAQMLGNRWDQITDDAFAKAKSAKSLEDGIEAYTWGLAGATRIDDQVRIQQATSQLMMDQSSGLAKTDGDADRGADLRWRVLALHDDVSHAIDVLATIDKPRASKLASLTSRFDRAEELCGFDLEKIATDLDDWIDDAYAEQAALPTMTLAPSLERLYSLARLLLSLGDADNAYRIYRRLTSDEIIVSQYGVSLREQTLNELELVNRLDWMRDFAVTYGEKAIKPRARRIVAFALNTEDNAFENVLDRVSVVLPQNADLRQRFQLAFQLFRGIVPSQFDPSTDFRRLFDALVHHEQIRRIGGRVQQVETVSLDLEIIEMFLRNGQVELVREGLAILARQENVDALISVAEMELEQGDSRTAAEKWTQVAALASRFTATEAVITLDHGLASAKAVAAQWILAKRAGHLENSDQLERRLRFMLTSPSLSFRKELADYLKKMQQYELAAVALRDLTVLASFGGDEAPDFFRVAIAYADVIDDIKDSNPATFDALGIDPKDAVRWSDLAVLGILKNTLYHDKAFVSVPLSVRKAFLQHAIESKDAELANRSIRQIEAYDPINIDFGERMLPELRKSGQETLADAAFDRLMDRGTTHIERFGTDATALNNLAWTAAMNQRRLDQALQLSSRAVMLEPDSVIFRDTLAEVLHLLGRTNEALEIESGCLLDESDEWHIHEQVAKYRKLLGR